jgi:hypothetical protein
MTSAATTANYIGAFGASANTGVSDKAGIAKQNFKRVIGHYTQTSSGQKLADLYNGLIEVFKDYSESNWDGYGARPISRDAFVEGQRIIDLLSGSPLPLPEILPESGGEIAFEWRNRDRVFVASVKGNQTIEYAGVFGKYPGTHGLELFAESIPATIVANINRVFTGI